MSQPPAPFLTAPARPATAEAAASHSDASISSVLSPDGTSIGYRRFGAGPVLILLHGSASSGAYHVELARLLADAFTVIVPDRRGRGLSGPYRPGDELAQELGDLGALVEATGASDVWGLSSGAVIALEAARTMPAVRRVGLFEPPLFRDRAPASDVLARFDGEMARGQLGRAMVTAMRGAEMGPAWFRALPKALTSRLVQAGMRKEAKAPAGEYPTMAEIAPTLHYDFAVVAAASGDLDQYRTVDAVTQLMGGSKSPTFLKRALDDLAGIIPGATRLTLDGVDHAASWNRDRGGNPEPVATELRRFFA